MRVLWLSPGFAADEQDLNCIPPLQLLARALVTKGIDLQIITLGYPFHSKPYTWHGIPVISGYGPNRRWFRWYNWRRVVRYAQDIHREQNFDVLHSFWLGPSWLIGQYLQKRWNIPHYTTLMGQDVLSRNRYRHFLRAGHASSFVAVSDFQNNIFEKTTGKRSAHTIPWGVDKAEIPETLPDHRPLDILGCGSFIPLKNWVLWLNVLAGVAKSKPDLRAELIGDGVERAQIEGLIKRLRLERNVRLRGHIPRPDVMARMRDTKVLLHTANFESFGFVLAEAAMNGCRVVSTPVGIAPQLAACGRTSKQLMNQTLLALDQTVMNTPFSPFMIAETAEEYRTLYNSQARFPPLTSRNT